MAALRRLDTWLGDFIDELGLADDDQLRVGVTSDHGCRQVDTAIIPWPVPSDAGVLLQGLVITATGEIERLPLPVEYLRTYVDRHGERRPAMVFDGGSMRLWVSEGHLQAVVEHMQATWGRYLSRVVTRAELPAVVRAGEQSLHEGWGDVVGLAAENVALCKPSWLRPDSTGRMLPPCGEHGSDHDLDRKVPVWGAPVP